MRDNYDFSDAVKNPFAGREKGKYTVTVHYDFTDAAEAETEEQVVDDGIAQKQQQSVLVSSAN
jgi:hypothetical protein